MTAGPLVAAEMLELRVAREGNRYFVDSRTLIEAPVEAVYDVLADYDRLHELSSVFDETRVVSRDAQGRAEVVYLRARGCVLFFCRTIERYDRLTQQPPVDLLATAVPPPAQERASDPSAGASDGEDAEAAGHAYSVSRWQLSEHPQGTEVIYSLEMEPDFWVPPLVGPWALKRKLASGAGDAADRVEQRALGLPVTID